MHSISLGHTDQTKTRAELTTESGHSSCARGLREGFPKKQFCTNGYPEEVVHSAIDRKLKSVNRDAMFGPLKCPVSVKLPYIGQPSEQFERKISKVCMFWICASKNCFLYAEGARSFIKRCSTNHFYE